MVGPVEVKVEVVLPHIRVAEEDLILTIPHNQKVEFLSLAVVLEVRAL